MREPLDFDDLVVLIKDAYWDEEADHSDEFFDDGIEELWEERKTLTGIIAAAKRVRDEIDKLIANKLGPATSVRLDDFQVKLAPSRRLRVIDPEGFKNWVGKDWDEVINVTSATLRVKALRAIAEKRDEDPDMALDAFCKWIEGEPRVTTIPIDKAPKYAQDMEHGETR